MVSALGPDAASACRQLRQQLVTQFRQRYHSTHHNKKWHGSRICGTAAVSEWIEFKYAPADIISAISEADTRLLTPHQRKPHTHTHTRTNCSPDIRLRRIELSHHESQAS